MLQLVPITQEDAFKYVQRHHRHHKAPTGSIFQIAASDGEKIVGVITVGRPLSKYLDKGMGDGFTAEVNRLCTDGTKNCCSFLYAAAWRVARNLGYKRLITYILASESGGSLEASGWKKLYQTRGGKWDSKKRPRIDKHPTEPKIMFEMDRSRH